MTETIIKAYPFALDPTDAQVETLGRYATASRYGFNFALGDDDCRLRPVCAGAVMTWYETGDAKGGSSEASRGAPSSQESPPHRPAEACSTGTR
ncbi:helix-turn-helix domain-containing protein [Streptomyces violascens]|uniref:helix-turn-helix domain-containing protein n=1 Tax=Streptomyces violascens TaxID=67381 RepID=UPI00167903C2|nr:helix-turn-helix domain-containing protein [Streptomyces violascens]GGU41364.1 hypothetical protein GCM10010289_72850 [Streptomyces violascens]